jgi:hypothetical protein
VKRSLLGVAVGGIVDVVTTNVFSVPVLLAVSIAAAMNGHSKEYIQAATLAAVEGTGLTHLVLIGVGCVCSILGGYVAAWIAGKNELLTGALSAWLCVGIEIYALATNTSAAFPRAEIISLLPLSPALGALGGHLRGLQSRRRTRAA